MSRTLPQWIARKRRRRMEVLMMTDRYEELAPHLYRSAYGGTLDDARKLLRDRRARIDELKDGARVGRGEG